MEHHLPLRQAIDRSGRLTDISGPYKGLSVDEAKKKITEDMRGHGIIFKQEPLEQNVGLCWRCKTPIEILSEQQWFVRINAEEIKKTAEQIEWIPPHMRVRLDNWADSMEWDWCISRQRIFATPIPVWYCRDCQEVLVADEKWLPLDPNQTRPPVRCKCGSDDFIPEQDVLDTWMDSSISALSVAGWPDRKDLRMPTQLRPQGHDIIRTWAFYTILRTKSLEGVKPWDSILINGMALGEDGHKMSKSLNNFIRPEEVFETNGADALRAWAAIGGSPGNDIPFQWKEITAASRFQQKLWSIFRFSRPLIDKVEANPGQVDRWLLGELDQLVVSATRAMDGFQFDETMKAIRAFAWDVLADNYIELVKARLYGPDGPQKRAAQNTLYTALETIAKLMAPFAPFLSEEIYHSLTGESVHVANWPKATGTAVDPAGHAIKEIAAALRRYKAEKGMALNSPLTGIMVYSDMTLETFDLVGVANSPVESMTGCPKIEMKPKAVKPQMKIIGPRFKDKSHKIINALSAMDPNIVASQKTAGQIRVELEGEVIEVPPEAATIEIETLSAGEAVDILNLGAATVLVRR
jgi:Valyl-tRNA synthetase